jgi:outer membrane protein OmpA-like peptidoglycan-associated protein
MTRKLTLISTIVTGTILAAGAVYGQAAAPAPDKVYNYAGGQTYMATFAMGSSKVTAEAEKAITSAAEAAKAGPTKIVLRAHADTVGPKYHNFRLGEMRGEAVKAKLVKLGVPEDHINVYSHGESVTLPAGMKESTPEQQNRNVEIIVVPVK